MLERGQLRWEPQFSPLLQSMQINYLATVRQSSQAPNHPPETKAKSGKARDPDMDRRWKEADSSFCVPYQTGACQQPACSIFITEYFIVCVQLFSFNYEFTIGVILFVIISVLCNFIMYRINKYLHTYLLWPFLSLTSYR